ncbi:MAG: DUF2064 domain-containing protein [Planctomycetota bacterium]|nr:DUF2064 domain-containing protein [Planctomycetota bacterium]
MSTCFAMLVTDPQSGTVRPGLAEVVGAPAAAKVYRSFIMDLCERFSRLSADSRILCYGPRGARKSVGLLASRQWRLVQQEGGSRGAVLANLFERAFRLGARRAVVLLTECPTVPDAFVIEAFDRLLIDDVVLGPTTRGGLYLVGLSLERPELFLGVDFGAAGVFDAVVDRAEAFGLILGLVPHWYDVDGRAGLDLLAGHLRALGAAGSESMPKRTQTLFQRLRLAE